MVDKAQSIPRAKIGETFGRLGEASSWRLTEPWRSFWVSREDGLSPKFCVHLRTRDPKAGHLAAPGPFRQSLDLMSLTAHDCASLLALVSGRSGTTCFRTNATRGTCDRCSDLLSTSSPSRSPGSPVCWRCARMALARGRRGRAVVALHLWMSDAPRREVMLLVIGRRHRRRLGWIPGALGFLEYPSGMMLPWLAPVWIIAMWVAFATTLNVALGWLKGRWTLAAVLGGIGDRSPSTAAQAWRRRLSGRGRRDGRPCGRLVLPDASERLARAAIRRAGFPRPPP